MTIILAIPYIIIVTYVFVTYFDRALGVSRSVVEDLSE